MTPQGSAVPKLFDEAVVRSEDIVELLDALGVVSTTSYISDAVPCAAFRHFLLHLDIDSEGSPTTLHVEVQFLQRWSGKWHTLKQGPFASLFYEYTDVASGIQECFEGLCAGRAIRLKLTGVGTTSSAYFTVTAALEFFN